MKLMIVTDAWIPQVNGVVRTLGKVRDGLTRRGWKVKVVGPSAPTFPCPTEKHLRLSLWPSSSIERELSMFDPDYIHIATEGPLGRAMRRICLQNNWRFTTSFHTRFPEYLKARLGIPRRWTYSYLRRFHAPAAHTLVPTTSIRNELNTQGFNHLTVWGRGVDTDLFHPNKRQSPWFAGPVFLYVGRVAIEKNIEAFLAADLGPCSKVVVGDGPARESLKRRFPSTIFLGPLFGHDLAEVYASADVFVFPSRTDTYGLVILEALASGLPVAAYDVPGPRDILGGTKAGALNEDLSVAALSALKINREECRQLALHHSWDQSCNQFASSLHRKSTNSYQSELIPIISATPLY